LGYTEGAASRRIASMRLLRELPELKEDLVTGRQSLSSLSLAQKFFRTEEKYQAQKLTADKKRWLLKTLEGKSSRECERELLSRSSAPMELKNPERTRAVGEAHTEIRLVVDEALLRKLRRIQEIRSHAEPTMSYVKLLDFMADEVLERI